MRQRGSKGNTNVSTQGTHGRSINGPRGSNISRNTVNNEETNLIFSADKDELLTKWFVILNYFISK